MKADAAVSDRPHRPASVNTHCPYCALQCGMPLRGDGPRRGRRCGRRDFPTNRGRLCQKGWTAAELLHAADRLTTPLVRGADGQLEPASWDEALDIVAARLARIRAEHGPDAVAVFGGGGLTNEKAYQLGQVRPGRAAAPARSTTTAGSACRRPRPPATAPSASTAGCRSRSPTSRGADACCSPARNLAETMPPFVRHLDRERGGADRHRPPAHRRRRERAGAAPAADARHRPRARPRPAARRRRRGAGRRRTTSRERTAGFDAACAARPRRGGPSGSSGSPACRSPQHARRGRGCSPTAGQRVRPHRPGRRAARQGHRHGDRVHQPGPRARPAGPAGHAATAASPGRATARAAASTARRPTSCPATGRSTTRPPAPTSPRCGASRRTTCRAPAARAYELLDALGTADGPRALLVFGSNPRRLRAARRARRRRGSPRSTCSWSADVVLSETAALADVVLPVTQWAEEERHDDQPRRPGAAAAGTRSPAAGVRSDLRDPARSWPPAGRTGRPLPDRSRARSSTSCAGPAPAAGPTTPASPTSGSTPGRGVFWPCPAAGRTPRHPAAVPRPLRHPRRPGPVRAPSSTGRPAEDIDARLPRLPDHRPGAGALPVAARRPGGSPR